MTQEAKIIELGPHDKMNVEQTLGAAERIGFESIIIIGYDEVNDFRVLSSHMVREQALWLIEHAKLHVMGRLD